MNPWRDLAGLPPAVWALAAATFINRAGTMALALLVLFLDEQRGFGMVSAGLVVGTYGLAAVLMAPISGRLSDRFGARPIVDASLLLGGLVFVLFPLAQSPWLLVAMTIALAVTNEPFRPACLVLITNAVPHAQRKQAFVLLRLAINLGLSVGPAAGSLLAELSFESVFLINGAASWVALLVLHKSDRTSAALRAPEHQDAPAQTPRVFDRRFFWFLCAGFVTALVFFQHMSPMSLFIVHDLGLRKLVYGLTFTCNTVLIVLIESRLNAAMAHWPHSRVLALGAALTAVGFGALAFCDDVYEVFATVPVWTFGEMMLFPTMSTYVADIAPPGKIGSYMGSYSMCFNLAYMVGPPAGVYLLDRHGPQALWLITGAVGLLPVWMFLWEPAIRRDRRH